MTENKEQFHEEKSSKTWIRGVNVGGWLLAERFLTPYLFAVNSCHLEGDLCWYPGQAAIRSSIVGENGFVDEELAEATEGVFAKYNTSNICDPKRCHPIQPVPVKDGNSDYHPLHAERYNDYPIDEWTLGQTFSHNRTLGRLYMERHWDTFVTKQDLLDLKAAGVTHMRVPLSFWIRNTDKDGNDHIRIDPTWISGGWKYFVRFAKWAREIGGLEIWADLHGAPGSENGFDNSGQYLGGSEGGSTCLGWSDSAENIEKTLDILTDLVQAMADEGLHDVVTGFGLLNEPFLDCDAEVLRNYYNNGLQIVRTLLGPETSVFVGDMFRAWRFNDGFWADDEEHYKTYLDSHPYHVFAEKLRAFTPRQHIAYVCKHGAQDVESCCYEDHDRDAVTGRTNSIPAKGISRIMGEWSAAYDILPTALTPHIMKTIASQGVAPLLNRSLSKARQTFLRNFVEAQMVAYESKSSGVSSGWLWWNFKVEGGAFAEWDFLRGIKEGWIPNLPDSSTASEDLFGSCLDIYNRTDDNYTAIIDEYPDPRTLDWNLYQGWDATDDFVLSDPNIPVTHYDEYQDPHWKFWHRILPVIILIVGVLFSCRKRLFGCKLRERLDYEQLK